MSDLAQITPEHLTPRRRRGCGRVSGADGGGRSAGGDDLAWARMGAGAPGQGMSSGNTGLQVRRVIRCAALTGGDPRGRMRTFVRQMEWQNLQAVHLWVDRSASMQYRGEKGLPLKGERARVLGLAAAILLAKAGESVGLMEDPQPPKHGRVGRSPKWPCGWWMAAARRTTACHRTRKWRGAIGRC